MSTIHPENEPFRRIEGFKVDPDAPTYISNFKSPKQSALSTVVQTVLPHIQEHQKKVAALQEKIASMQEDLASAEWEPVVYLGERMHASEQWDLLNQEVVKLDQVESTQRAYLKQLETDQQPEGLDTQAKKQYLQAHNKALEQAKKNLAETKTEKMQCEEAIKTNEIVQLRTSLEQELTKLVKENENFQNKVFQIRANIHGG